MTEGEIPQVVKRNPRDRETGKRVKVIRMVQGYETAAEMAGALDIKRQRLTNIENGHPLSIDVAKRLKESIPGLTLDWLYYGEVNGLTVDLARRIKDRARALDKG